MNRDARVASAHSEAQKLVDIPGVIAIGRAIAGAAAAAPVRKLVVTLAEKRAPDAFAAGEDVATVLAPAPIDVRQASPLQLLFTSPSASDWLLPRSPSLKIDSAIVRSGDQAAVGFAIQLPASVHAA